MYVAISFGLLAQGWDRNNVLNTCISIGYGVGRFFNIPIDVLYFITWLVSLQLWGVHSSFKTKLILLYGIIVKQYFTNFFHVIRGQSNLLFFSFCWNYSRIKIKTNLVALSVLGYYINCCFNYWVIIYQMFSRNYRK